MFFKLVASIKFLNFIWPIKLVDATYTTLANSVAVANDTSIRVITVYNANFSSKQNYSSLENDTCFTHMDCLYFISYSPEGDFY